MYVHLCTLCRFLYPLSLPSPHLLCSLLSPLNRKMEEAKQFSSMENIKERHAANKEHSKLLFGQMQENGILITVDTLNGYVISIHTLRSACHIMPVQKSFTITFFFVNTFYLFAYRMLSVFTKASWSTSALSFFRDEYSSRGIVPDAKA
jgi:hypothetical protein